MEKSKSLRLGSDTLLKIMILAFALLRIVNFFYEAIPLQVLSCVIMLFVMAVSLSKLNKMTGRVILVMFLIGIGLMVVSGASAKQWLYALLKNGNLVMLLTMAPMLSAPFFYEDYQSELKTLAQVKMQNLLSFLVLLTLSSHLLGVLVSIGAVIIVYDLLHPFGKLYNAEKEFVTTITRSYSSSGFWSPAWACVIVYSAYPDVKWVSVIPIAILFTIIFNAISLGSIGFAMRKHPEKYPRLTPTEGARVNTKKIVTMLVLFLGMIGTIILISVITNWDLMLVVPVAAVLFPIAAALIQKKVPAYKQGLTNYYNKSLMKLPGQVALYAAAGFLGKAMEVSGVGAQIPKLLPTSLTSYPPLMIAALVIMMVIPALAGIHPVAMGTAMVASLSPAALGLTNYTYCLAIIFGWIMAVMLSPFSSQTLILSGNTGRNNWDISVGSNWKFCLVCTVIFSLLISFIGPLMG